MPGSSSFKKELTLNANHAVWVHGELGNYYYVRPGVAGQTLDATNPSNKDSANFYFVEKSKVDFSGIELPPFYDSEIRQPNGSYIWPLEKRYKISQYYSYPNHQGLDITGTTAKPIRGANVIAADSGTVVAVCNDADDEPDTSTAGTTASYGNYIMIDHGSNRYTRYPHLQKGSVLFTEGQTVLRGTPIGRAGESGNATAPHLHFEVYSGGSDPQTNRINPEQFYNDTAQY